MPVRAGSASRRISAWYRAVPIWPRSRCTPRIPISSSPPASWRGNRRMGERASRRSVVLPVVTTTSASGSTPTTPMSSSSPQIRGRSSPPMAARAGARGITSPPPSSTTFRPTTPFPTASVVVNRRAGRPASPAAATMGVSRFANGIRWESRNTATSRRIRSTPIWSTAARFPATTGAPDRPSR